MSRRRLFQVLAATVVGVCLLVFTGVLSAQGNSDNAFERVKEVQERHTAKFVVQRGVVGTAVGLNDNGQHVVLVLLETEGVPDIPDNLEGVPVRRVVTGTIQALPKPPAASKVPAAPSNLAATAGGSTQINLTWKDNATNETGFKLERGIVAPSGISYSQIATTGADVTTYSDTSLSASTTYSYRIRAYNKFGNSTYSNEASATTAPTPANPPAAPTGLTAAAAGSTQINLVWADRADNEAGFKIERATTGSFSQIATTGANTTSYSDPGLTSSTTYTYRVRAYNDAGYSGYSNEASATTDAAPTNPWRFPRPVPIGVSTGHPTITAGTISCRVRSGDTVYALSNNHVYAASNAAHIGDAVIQPGTYDDGTSPADNIGTLSAFKEILWSPYPFPLYTNTIDAAIALTTDKLVGQSTPSGGYGIPKTAIVVAELNMGVQKYGRTTGLTRGTIQGVNVATWVGYGSGHYAYFTGQIMIGPSGFSSGGDSGSLIVTDDVNCNPVGLLFAGSDTTTIANLIGPVLSNFGVSIDGQ